MSICYTDITDCASSNTQYNYMPYRQCLKSAPAPKLLYTFLLQLNYNSLSNNIGSVIPHKQTYGPSSQNYVIVFHPNIGYPLLSTFFTNEMMYFSSTSVTPRVSSSDLMFG